MANKMSPIFPAGKEVQEIADKVSQVNNNYGEVVHIL